MKPGKIQHVIARTFSSAPRIHCDALVIGAGIAGTSVAYELCNNHGLNVVILEKEHFAGYHSTGRAAGLFAENYGSDAVQLLTMASREWFQNPPAKCNPNVHESPFLTKAGTIWTSQPQHQSTMLDKFYSNSPHKETLEIIGRERAKQIQPLLRYEDHALIGDKFVYDASAMALDTGNVHQSYLRGCKASQVDIFCDQSADVIERCNEHGCNWQITTNTDRSAESKTFESRLLINASGAWADEIAVKAGLKAVGITPLRRCLIIFEPHNAETTTYVERHKNATDPYIMPWVLGVDGSGKEFWYMAPQGLSGQLLCSPANKDEDEAGDAYATDLELAICIDRIETFTKCKVERIKSKWAGLRCYAKDESFVIGADENDDTFFWCAGLAGQGIQAAPAYAALLANLICKEDVPVHISELGFDVSTVLPQRFNPAMKFP